MTIAAIIDNTGISEHYLPGFCQEDMQWMIVSNTSNLQHSLPELVIFMQVPAEVPSHWNMPVLINDTVGDFQMKPDDQRPIARFCGWKTMIERPVWEISALNDSPLYWVEVVEKWLNRKLCIVPDEPGFIAPRILASIINEACYGLADKICSSEDLDIAMRLGTNYPKGPITWMHEIGKENIAALLSKLALQHPAYSPHPLLYSEEMV